MVQFFNTIPKITFYIHIGNIGIYFSLSSSPNYFRIFSCPISHATLFAWFNITKLLSNLLTKPSPFLLLCQLYCNLVSIKCIIVLLYYYIIEIVLNTFNSICIHKKNQSICLNNWVLQLSPGRIFCICQVDSLNVTLSQVHSTLKKN